MAPRLPRRLFAVAAATMLLGAATGSLAVPITVPTGLNPGDQYRLVFVTSTTRDGTSTDIADYNSFVLSAANAVPLLASLGTTWTAIASTATVNAIANTGTDPTPAGANGVPIFLLNDTTLANDYDDLWDGTIDNPLMITENGVPFPPVSWAWTGTDASGATSSALGAGTGPLPSANIGLNEVATSQWIALGPNPQVSDRSLYAISGILTVVPEPGTASLLTLGLVTLGLVRRHV